MRFDADIEDGDLIHYTVKVDMDEDTNYALELVHVIVERDGEMIPQEIDA